MYLDHSCFTAPSLSTLVVANMAPVSTVQPWELTWAHIQVSKVMRSNLPQWDLHTQLWPLLPAHTFSSCSSMTRWPPFHSRCKLEREKTKQNTPSWGNKTGLTDVQEVAGGRERVAAVNTQTEGRRSGGKQSSCRAATCLIQCLCLCSGTSNKWQLETVYTRLD